MSTKYLKLFTALGYALVFASAILVFDSPPVAQAGHGLPHATITIWKPNNTFPTFGNDPNMTVTDPAGLTNHVATLANPLTNITVYENTFCSGLPCGVTYWNPATNLFKCYGYSGGFMNGVDLNRSAPVKTGPDGTTYGPGDTWLFKSTGQSLTVNFPGTNTFRSWEAGNVAGGAVDQGSGLVWYADTIGGGRIGVFDPATNVTTRWTVGGTPRDIEVDSSGRAYATVGCSNAIVRVNSSTNEVVLWPVPGGGLRCGVFNAFNENPDGITIDSAGRVWFSESQSDEVARLDTSTNQICEYKKTGMDEPQNIATSGSGGLLQAFFAEAAGNAVSIVTQVEAAGTTQETCTTVTPVIVTVAPSTATLVPSNATRIPTQKLITPTSFDVPGVDGVPGSGVTKTPDGIDIPGILRFPIPPGSFRPTGMTDVHIPNTVFGSNIGTEDMYGVKSGAIIAPPPGKRFDKFFDPPKGDPAQGPDQIKIGQATTTKYTFKMAYETNDPANPPSRLVDTVPAEFNVVSAVASAPHTANVFLTSQGQGESSTKITVDLPAGPVSVTVSVEVQTRKLPNGKRYKPTSCGLVPLNSGPAFVYEVDPGTGAIRLDEFGRKIVLAGPSTVIDIVAVEDPANPDNDGDGIPNDVEARELGTNPCSADTDHDGISDLEELTVTGTSPLRLDTDADGLSDGHHPAPGLPHEFCEQPQGTNALNPDTDGDGLLDGDEVRLGTNPLNPDTDADGVLDGADAFPLDPTRS